MKTLIYETIFPFPWANTNRHFHAEDLAVSSFNARLFKPNRLVYLDLQTRSGLVTQSFHHCLNTRHCSPLSRPTTLSNGCCPNHKYGFIVGLPFWLHCTVGGATLEIQSGLLRHFLLNASGHTRWVAGWRRADGRRSEKNTSLTPRC